jgi:hypothetical protein
MIAIFAWIGLLVLDLINKQRLPKIVGFIIPGVVIFCHFLALVIWAGIAEVEWGECED